MSPFNKLQAIFSNSVIVEIRHAVCRGCSNCKETHQSSILSVVCDELADHNSRGQTCVRPSRSDTSASLNGKQH